MGSVLVTSRYRIHVRRMSRVEDGLYAISIVLP